MIAVIACGARKANTASPAKDLYLGTLFRKARAAVEALGTPWLIMSARHGLLLPDQIVQPYDQPMNTTDVVSLRRTLQRQVRAGMLGRGQVICDFTPAAYHALLSAACGPQQKFIRPVEGLGQGRCMHIYGLIAAEGELVTGHQVYGIRAVEQ